MPIYRSPIVGTGTELDPFRSPYGGDPRMGSLLLGPPGTNQGVCVMWLPDAVIDARLEKVAEEPRERVTGQTRSRLANALGVTLVTNKPIAELVAELLMDHGRDDGTRWKGIRGFPSKLRRRHEIWLGELGCIWFEEAAIGPSTQSFTETFPANSNVNTGQDRPWTNIESSNTVRSGQAEATLVNTLSSSRCDSALDTSNQRISGTYTVVAGATQARILRMLCRFSDADNYYSSFLNANTADPEKASLGKRVAGVTTVLDPSLGTPDTTGTAMLELDGATVTGQAGTFTNQATDASPQLLTTFTCGFLQRSGGGVTTNSKLDNLTIEDVVSTVTRLVDGGLLHGGKLIGGRLVR